MPLESSLLSEGAFLDELRLLHLTLAGVPAAPCAVNLSGLVGDELLQHDRKASAHCAEHVDAVSRTLSTGAAKSSVFNGTYCRSLRKRPNWFSTCPSQRAM